MPQPLPLVYFAGERGRRVLRALYPLISADAATTWIQVAFEGTWEGHSAGAFTFSRDVFNQIVTNFERDPNPIPVDYEHSTQRESPAPACGWVQKLEVRSGTYGSELWAFVELTDEAAQWVREGRYKFSSGVFDFDAVDLKSGESVGAEMFSLALTNVPFIRGQKPIQLSRRKAVALSQGAKMNSISLEAFKAAAKFFGRDELTMEEIGLYMAAAAARDGAQPPADGEKPKAEAEAKPAEAAAPAAAPAQMSATPPAAPAATLAAPEAAPEGGGDKGAMLQSFLQQTGLTVEELMSMLQSMMGDAGSSTPLSTAALNHTIAALSKRAIDAEKLLSDYRGKEADEAVALLVDQGKLLENGKATMRAIYLSNRAQFDSLAAASPQIVPVGKHASEQTPPTEATPAINEDDPLVKAIRRQMSNTKLSREQQDVAIRKELARNQPTARV